MFVVLDTDGLDSASQRNVAIEQKKFISALYKHIANKYEPQEAAERYSAILLRIPTIRVGFQFLIFPNLIIFPESSS